MSNDHPVPKTFLSIEDQTKLITRVSLVQEQTPWTDLFPLKYGDYVATCIAALSGLGMWHVGYVAWNIKKYSKGRVFTAFIALIPCPAGGLLYNMKVKRPLWKAYRKEDKWYYGIKAVAANQLSLLLQTGFSLGYTFTAAQMAGMMPVEDNFLSRKHRMSTLNYVLTRLAPFKRRLIAINAVSSALLFCLATRSYTESCQLLDRVGRKTLCEKED